MTNVLHKIPFGSQVYGLTNPLSDKDFAYIVDSSEGLDNTDDECYTPEEFQTHLNNHDLKAIELYFTCLSLQKEFNFKLDKKLLRSSVSRVVSNSHVKAKKKFKDNEIYIGLKSYYHCIRILVMMNYLALHEEFNPRNFKNELSYVYQDIMSRLDNDPSTLFEELEQDYKKLLKNLQHTFRLYCPK